MATAWNKFSSVRPYKFQPHSSIRPISTNGSRKGHTKLTGLLVRPAKGTKASTNWNMVAAAPPSSSSPKKGFEHLSPAFPTS
eukprot:1336232-Amorphochlora_amoeboformis.AAC.1